MLASIKAHLPLTLRQLDVGGKRTAPGRSQGTPSGRKGSESRCPRTETIRLERESLDHAWRSLINDEQASGVSFGTRVNNLMHRYGYRTDSVLLELAQNADDALAQAA